MVGHAALNRAIRVRIPASQPLFFAILRLALERFLKVCLTRRCVPIKFLSALKGPCEDRSTLRHFAGPIELTGAARPYRTASGLSTGLGVAGEAEGASRCALIRHDVGSG